MSRFIAVCIPTRPRLGQAEARSWLGQARPKLGKAKAKQRLGQARLLPGQKGPGRDRVLPDKQGVPP